MRRSVFVLVLALATVSACAPTSGSSADDTPSTTGSAPAGSGGSQTTPAKSQGPDCDALGQADLDSLAGTPVKGPARVPVSGLETCQWRSADGETVVQVITQPAKDWAQTLPTLLDQFEKTGLASDATTKQKFAAARRLLADPATMDATEACGLFSTLAELQGMEQGADYVVNLVPTKERPVAISGQVCRAGVFASVTLKRAGLSGTSAQVDDVFDAVTSAHRSATGG